MRTGALTKSTRFVRQFSVLGFLLLLVVVFAALADGFLSISNLINVALQTSIIAIVATAFWPDNRGNQRAADR
jgi:ribose/xylose/arabinose/galactoside ABC-type transport system permease subunit